MNKLKIIILASFIFTVLSVQSQEHKNYAVIFNGDIENLLDTVLFYPNSSPTQGTLRCAAMENGKKKKGVKGKVVPSSHVTKAFFHNKTYITIPDKKLKNKHLIHIVAFSDSDILVAAEYGNALNVWVIDRKTFEWKTRQYALRKKKGNVDYNLKYFDKAIEGSFKNHPDLIKAIRSNLKSEKPLDEGYDYYNCGGSKDLYESLTDYYKELFKKLNEKGRPDSYERAF